jgi:hypothetical protein
VTTENEENARTNTPGVSGSVLIRADCQSASMDGFSPGALVRTSVNESRRRQTQSRSVADALQREPSAVRTSLALRKFARYATSEQVKFLFPECEYRGNRDARIWVTRQTRDRVVCRASGSATKKPVKPREISARTAFKSLSKATVNATKPIIKRCQRRFCIKRKLDWNFLRGCPECAEWGQLRANLPT